MKFDPNKHHRQSIRLKGYDYSTPGFYLITICTQNRECVFGSVSEKKMRLNGPGKMVETVWIELPEFYPNVRIDEMIVMPDHIHGIINILPPAGVGPRANPGGLHANPDVDPGYDWNDLIKGHPRGDAPAIQPLSLPDIVYRFKSFTTSKYINGVHANKWPPFNKRLWQRNYHDHIVRNAKDLQRLREYVRWNPENWQPSGLIQGNDKRKV